MANMKAKISQSGKLKGKAAGQQSLVAKSAGLGASIALGDLSDVDVSGQEDNVMLQYDGSAGEYIVTKQIENIEIIGGT